MCSTVYITKTLELSTAHISKETNRLFERDEVEVVFYSKGANQEQVGWLMQVPVQDDKDAHIPDDLPEELYAIIAIAQENECQWIMFDRDADKIDSLSVFDW